MKRIAAAAVALALLALPASAQALTPSFSPDAPAGPAAPHDAAAAGPGLFGGTQLSSCMRNGLIGAGVGAVLGGVTGERNRISRAAIGAALGGVGTYFVCKYLGNRDQAKIERGYRDALASDAPVIARFDNEALGGAALLSVAAPMMASGDGDCRTLQAQLDTPGFGSAPLPRERFCRDARGAWAPAPLL